MDFIGSNFESPKWQHREAALMCFGSILEGPSVENLKPAIDQVNFNPLQENQPFSRRSQSSSKLCRIPPQLSEIQQRGSSVESATSSPKPCSTPTSSSTCSGPWSTGSAMSPASRRTFAGRSHPSPTLPTITPRTSSALKTRQQLTACLG